MADVEMSDAPRSADAGNGKAVEAKKKFEVKKVGDATNRRTKLPYC